jgi:two-component system cell cycle response regulator CtrA
MQVKMVLLIEDDRDYAAALQALIVETLKCYCDIYDNIKDGYEAACSGNYDVIILDLIFKKEKVIAHHFIWKLRSLGVKIPIIVISALWAVESKLKSFGFGADEYITKPYIPREVIARIVAIIRRFNGFASSVCKIGPFSIHLDNREVYCRNRKTRKETPVILTGKEYSILEILATKNGIVPKETLLNHLYGGLDEVPETKIIDVFVCKLRKKLILASDGVDLIQTVWGRGYQLNRNIPDEVSEENSENDRIGAIQNFIKSDEFRVEEGVSEDDGINFLKNSQMDFEKSQGQIFFKDFNNQIKNPSHPSLSDKIFETGQVEFNEDFYLAEKTKT